MDEETSIIDTNTRNEKIKIFFTNNKKKLLIIISIIILILIGYFGYSEYKDAKKKQISNYFNSTIIDYSNENKDLIRQRLSEIVREKDPTYSPLALYYIIDNDLAESREQVNSLFGILINETSLENEIKNLIIYKKALFNADKASELELLNILKPLTNSDSIWKSHALFLIGEFFYDKGETQKSKDFFNKIVLIENPNSEILINTQRRLNRDFSD